MRTDVFLTSRQIGYSIGFSVQILIQRKTERFTFRISVPTSSGETVLSQPENVRVVAGILCSDMGSMEIFTVAQTTLVADIY